MQFSYRPGQWNLLVVPGALVALSPQAADGLVTALWDRLRAESGLAAVVDAITEDAGGSFAAMPPFAAVVLEGAHARVALRGEVRARVSGQGDAQTLSGANVTTWSEHFVPDVRRVALYLAEAPGAPVLPILGGVVRAAEAVIEVDAGEKADAAAPVAVTGTLSAAEPSPLADVPSAAAVPGGVAPAPAVTGADVPGIPVPADAGVAGIGSDEGPVPVPEEASAPAGEPADHTAVEPSVAPPEPEPEPEPEVEPEPEPEAPVEPEPVSDQTLIPPDHTIDADFDEFQQLFGDTVHVPPPAPGPIGGDHDGATISVAQARALRGELPPPPPPAPVSQAAPDAPTALLPTAVGRVRVSTGQVVALDRTVVIGRRPRAPRASGASLPHLIAVESPQQDISRSHLEIRPEGDTVVVVDLHTTNGSTLLRPGSDPVRLHPGEATLVLTGDVIDLGDGITVAFEDLP